jgi:lon-related putative ATP-dependent protease
VAPDDLYRRCDPDGLGFETTAEVEPLDVTVGQDRALNAMQFGLEIRSDGYNLFVAGPPGTGRNSTLRATVRRMAAERPLPPDWCYVHNFHDYRQPSVLSLPAGRGRALARAMDGFIDACRREIPRHFESEEYAERREEVSRELQAAREATFSPVEAQARERGFTLNPTQMGIATVPLKPDGQPMSREEFAALPEETRRDMQAKGDELQSLISQAMMQVRRLEKDATAKLEEIDRAQTLQAITPLLNELRQEYVDIPRAIEYIDHVQDDIVEQRHLFRPAEAAPDAMALFRPPAEDALVRYKVNVIVAQDANGGAPVVVEDNPTYYNLFGRVDYRQQLGAVSTDHTMIKAGAIHRANGGYLIVQAIDMLTSPLVWETLKRTLRAEEARIENLGEQFSAIPVATLNPQPIPLDVKVVIVGSSQVYHTLYRVDDDFRKLFRVKSDFTTDMERNGDSVRLYAGFIASRVKEEGLRHFDKGAIARVVEHGSRLVEHQGKLSTRFIEIGEVLTEADFWAAKDGADIARREHVERAIDEKVYRSNLIEERVQDVIEEGTVMVDTEGGVVGQVNGIAVYDLGDHRFGRPSRITARTALGRGQVVSIEREIQLSGRIHSKGFMIVNGYLTGKYGQERPLSLSASIGFEQTYDEIDGDSASAAELYVLLSALANVPIKQGVAVTGSVNQRGEIQAIGGANEKIEGFYAVCKAKGLTGEQGVVIPSENVKHLMLSDEVVDAVREGRFHVWAASTVDEGIELLTGVPAGECDARGRYPADTVNRKVVDALARMSRRLSAAGRPRRKRDEGNDRRDGDSPDGDEQSKADES